ncbi:hypothetical protein AL755_15410 [Arthrobacter sp. ERGS1:01]|uniref:hypothetical protein n=1 Tax=Arthrobacter sp. ERGS1:01 TaxID=1704044 RepID=UPI0006B4C442|nr:hypothetical protein [Arthrobacter sp. ERGS1:01]ALE06520.1 hypothetical protein AL755_15410 [Arthrobacter sp. ERGS1:01]
MRYPLLWDTVRTTHLDQAEPSRTVEAALVGHVNYILMNTFRAGRMRGAFPGELTDPATEAHLEAGVDLTIDGAAVPGIRLNSDPDVLGLGADLGNGFLTVAVPREWLSLLRLEFVTRPPGAGR